MVHKRIRQRDGRGKFKWTSSTEKFENKQCLSQLLICNSDFHDILGQNNQISSTIKTVKHLSKNLQNIYELDLNKISLNYGYEGAYLVMANNSLSFSSL